MNKGKIIIRSSQIVKIAIVFFLIFLLVLQSGCTSAKNKTSSPSSPKKEVEKKSTVHDITKDEVYDKYIEASDFIRRNFLYQNDVDHDDGFKDSDGREFYRYTGDEFKSLEDVKAKLREYFTSDVVKEYETGVYKDRYIEKDGKLYSRYPGGIGFMGQINIDVERDGNNKFSIYHVYYPAGTHPDDVEWHAGFPKLDYVSEGKSKKSLVHCVRTKDGWKFDNVADQGVTGRIKKEFAQYDEKDKEPYKDILSEFEGYLADPDTVPENDYRLQRVKKYLLSDIYFGMLSYSLTDINDDGINELIFQQTHYGGEADGCFIIAMYTLVSGKPELVCTSTTDHDERYSIMEGGIIHFFSGGGIDSLSKLKPNSKDFEIIDIAYRFKGESLQDIGEFQTFKCRPVGL